MLIHPLPFRLSPSMLNSWHKYLQQYGSLNNISNLGKWRWVGIVHFPLRKRGWPLTRTIQRRTHLNFTSAEQECMVSTVNCTVQPARCVVPRCACMVPSWFHPEPWKSMHQNLALNLLPFFSYLLSCSIHSLSVGKSLISSRFGESLIWLL